MLALLHGYFVVACTERARGVSAGTVDVLTGRLVVMDVTVKHGGHIGHPAIGTSCWLVVISSFDLGKDFRNSRLDLVISTSNRRRPDDVVTGAGSKEHGYLDR